MDRVLRKMPLLVGQFCCILCQKAEEDLTIFFGDARLGDLFGLISSKCLIACLLDTGISLF